MFCHLIPVIISLCWSTNVDGSCIVPTTQVCGVTYPVPPSIASLASILESEITSAYNIDIAQSIGETCAKSLKEIRCAKSFPRCSNDSTQVTVTSLDCNQRLQCATSTYRDILTANHFCNLTENTFPFAGTCKPATQYGYEFGYCPVDVTRNISEWMFALLQYQDIYLSSSNVVGRNGFLAQNYPSCAASYAYYECIKIGQCDGCATNILVNYTREQCTALQSLCSSASRLVNIPDCSLWPLNVSRLQCNGTTSNEARDVTIVSGRTLLPSATVTSLQTVGTTLTTQATGTSPGLITIVAVVISILGAIALVTGLIMIIIAIIMFHNKKRTERYISVAPGADDTRTFELTQSVKSDSKNS